MQEQAIKPQDEIPLLTKMRELVGDAERLLATDNIYGRPASRIPRRFRALLSQLYGENSPLLGPFREQPSMPSTDSAREYLNGYLPTIKHVIGLLEAAPQQTQSPRENRVFIGHGRSPVWRELKDFLHERLSLLWEEFNREAVAGYGTPQRLQEMLSQSTFAFLIMTAEDEHSDASIHARPNVIHEIGLFQGRLGMHRAIVLLEDGCAEFSNIVGLSQIRFPRGHISATFEEVRRVLERERVI